MNNVPHIIARAGGHAKVFIEVLVMSNNKVLGDDESVLDYDPNEIELVNGLNELYQVTFCV